MKTKTIAVIASAALFPLIALAQTPPAPPAPAAPGVPAAPPAPPAPPNSANQRDHDRARQQPYTWLGIETSELPRVVSDQLGLPRGFGLVIDYVVPDGPAAQAGVQQNDILRMLNDQILMEPGQLSKLVRSYKDGDTVTLTVLRKGQEQKIQVKLAKHEPRDMHWHGGMPDLGELNNLGPEMERLRDKMQDMKEDLKEKLKEGVGKVDVDAIRDTVREAKRQALRASQEARRQARELRINSRDGNAMHSTRIDLGKAQVVYSDDKGEMRLESVGGKKVLTAKDPQGKLLFSGPVDTKEDQDKMPADVRERFNKIELKDLGTPNDQSTFGFTTKEDDNDNDADDDDDDDGSDDDGGASMEQVHYVLPGYERSIDASVI